MNHMSIGLSYVKQDKRLLADLLASQTYMKNTLIASETLLVWKKCRTQKRVC